MPEETTDRELLRQIVEEEDIQTEPGADLEALLQRLWDWISGFFGDGPSLDIDGVWEFAGIVGLALLLLAIAWVAWTVWTGRRRRIRRPVAPVRAEVLPPPPDPVDALEAALAAGDARQALHALWGEVAMRLGQTGVAAASGDDRTHQELVRAVRASRPDWTGHGDLRSLARQFDRLCYGATPPEVADVRALIPQARGLPA